MINILTIIGSVIFATGTIIGIYYNHKIKTDKRLNDLEAKIKHHEKFIEILERKALSTFEKDLDNKQH